MSLVLDALLLATACTHVLLTPYTKVEESFNLHATHDVLMYGITSTDLKNYDHYIFPGAVPRSFIGSILLAACSTPFIRILSYFGVISSKADLLIVVRLVLASSNAFGLCVLRRAVSKRFGFRTGVFFALLSASQFHLPFWMGRTLPNMFALLPVNLAYSYILDRMPNTSRPSPADVSKAIALLIFVSVVSRAEVVLLLGPLALQALLAKWISFSALLKTGLLSGVASCALTTVVDSYFWSSWPLWPEAYTLYFNVYLGKSSDWGVSPPLAYFTSHLPKLLLTSLPLSLLGFLTEKRIRTLLVSPILFTILISGLAHKEWRFIVYTVPLFNVAAARGAYWLTRQRTSTIYGRLCYLIVLGCIAVNTLVAFVMTQVSMANYPGGVALTRLNKLFADRARVHVHIDNLAAQTGASLFLQTHAPPFPPYLPIPPQTSWTYNKTEHLTPADITRAKHFTHAIAEFSPSSSSSSSSFDVKSWRTVECISGFDGFRVRKFGGGGGEGGSTSTGKSSLWERVPMVEFAYSDKLCILERSSST